MKSNQRNFSPPKDTPAIRKRRLQDRLKELTAKSEQEMAVVMQALEKMKTSITSKSGVGQTHEPDPNRVR